ncbi:hypothetical protein A0H81_11322 [Grifola frondosa]|uniref:Uncharacterized protein n=1 Tax=Grifola frondosa TaxID=5627 RepID=A0A1C7LXL6_GRIFR|nr:hypothetical protein A0H81_11322 [Grifola frondosa]
MALLGPLRQLYKAAKKNSLGPMEKHCPVFVTPNLSFPARSLVVPIRPPGVGRRGHLRAEPDVCNPTNTRTAFTGDHVRRLPIGASRSCRTWRRRPPALRNLDADHVSHPTACVALTFDLVEQTCRVLLGMILG